MGLRRGGWRRAALTQTDISILVGWTTAWAAVRALDYLTGRDAQDTTAATAAVTPAVAEHVAPLWAWAAVLLTGVALLLVGWRQRRHLLVFAGHLILGVTYTSLTLGLLGEHVGLLWATHDLASLDGARNGGPLGAVALLHAMLTLRTGTHPIPRDEAITDEAVVREAP